MSRRLALVFDQFVDWVVDCMFTPAIRTVGCTGVSSVLAAMPVWVLADLKLALIVFCIGAAFTCALALSMWLLFLGCRFVQHRSMNKILSFNRALMDNHHRRQLDPIEANVLLDDDLIEAEVEGFYAQLLAAQINAVYAQAENAKS